MLVNNIRGQSHDSAAVMKGEVKWLQELFKNINKYTKYVPSVPHSLNLMVEKAASTVSEIVYYFEILQQLYVFFSGLSCRWALQRSQQTVHYPEFARRL